MYYLLIFDTIWYSIMKRICAGLALLWVAVVVWAQPISKFVIFGDSLSDNGNSYQYSHHQKPPKPMYYEGRYSNGPIWIDYVHNMLLRNKKSPTLLNYAFGGAGVLQSQAQAFTLSQEVDSYLLAHRKPPEAHSWFVIWIGANDYLLHPDVAPDAANKVVAEIERNVVRLAQHGARHVSILALPDLGLSPFAQDLELQIPLSAISQKHNLLLKACVARLQARFPKIDWQYVDVNQIWAQLVSHPKQYGFTHTTERCTEPGTNPHRSHCEKYIFFDQFHPTTQVHKIFAQQFILKLNIAS